MANYNPKGPNVRDFLFNNGLAHGVFVNLNNECRPYIFVEKPTSTREYRDSVSIGYVTRGLLEAEVYHNSNTRLVDHLEDPLYDASVVDKNTPAHQIADMSLVTQARLRGVGD
ncbi:MAG: hypothetical protein AABX96_05220 [Nanoarchaeota archaeon]